MKHKRGISGIVVIILGIIIIVLMVMVFSSVKINKAFASIFDPLKEKSELETEDEIQKREKDAQKENFESAQKILSEFKITIEDCVKKNDISCTCGNKDKPINFLDLNTYTILVQNKPANNEFKNDFWLIDSESKSVIPSVNLGDFFFTHVDTYKDDFKDYKKIGDFLEFSQSKVILWAGNKRNEKFKGKMDNIYFSKPEQGVIVIDDEVSWDRECKEKTEDENTKIFNSFTDFIKLTERSLEIDTCFKEFIDLDKLESNYYIGVETADDIGRVHLIKYDVVVDKNIIIESADIGNAIPYFEFEGIKFNDISDPRFSDKFENDNYKDLSADLDRYLVSIASTDSIRVGEKEFRKRFSDNQKAALVYKNKNWILTKDRNIRDIRSQLGQECSVQFQIPLTPEFDIGEDDIGEGRKTHNFVVEWKKDEQISSAYPDCDPGGNYIRTFDINSMEWDLGVDKDASSVTLTLIGSSAPGPVSGTSKDYCNIYIEDQKVNEGFIEYPGGSCPQLTFQYSTSSSFTDGKIAIKIEDNTQKGCPSSPGTCDCKFSYAYVINNYS